MQRYCSAAAVVSLVATKADLPIVVKPEKAKAYAKEHSTLVAETSAKVRACMTVQAAAELCLTNLCAAGWDGC